MDINNVILIGRVVHNVKELKYTTNHTAIMELSIAVNKNKDKASFFDISVFGKLAETIKPYIAKGKQIAVQGTLEQQTWEKDGKKHSKVVILANSIQLLGSRQDSTQNAESAPAQAPAPAQTNLSDFPEDEPGFWG
jgi:single-strand DNA-binding protein